jgi:hypothetical protein
VITCLSRGNTPPLHQLSAVPTGSILARVRFCASILPGCCDAGESCLPFPPKRNQPINYLQCRIPLKKGPSIGRILSAFSSKAQPPHQPSAVPHSLKKGTFNWAHLVCLFLQSAATPSTVCGSPLPRLFSCLAPADHVGQNTPPLPHGVASTAYPRPEKVETPIRPMACSLANLSNGLWLPSNRADTGALSANRQLFLRPHWRRTAKSGFGKEYSAGFLELPANHITPLFSNQEREERVLSNPPRPPTEYGESGLW